MALKPNQLQFTTQNTKINSTFINDMIRFDLQNENKHENLEEQENNLFDYFLQPTLCLP
jgi:hypothetical protein